MPILLKTTKKVLINKKQTLVYFHYIENSPALQGCFFIQAVSDTCSQEMHTTAGKKYAPAHL